jgi:transcription termination factor Rho
VYVHPRLVRELGLRRGDRIAGAARGPRRSERHPTLVEVDTLNGRPAPEATLDRRRFEDLTASPLTVRFPLRHEPRDAAARMVDLLAPFAKGQRCLIAGPRGAGATRLLLAIARAVSGDAPIAILLGVRPEEQADLDVGGGVELHSLSAEARPLEQLGLAELALERAKRRVEEGEDAVVLLDSLTALARAYALAGERSGRSGRDSDSREKDAEKAAGKGVAEAVPAVMRWLASARATEEGGSLTIVATVRTGSDSTFEDLLYGGAADLADAELRLDRDLAEARLWPAIDPLRSRTRWHDPVDASADARRPMLRRRLATEEPARAWRLLVEEIDATASNEELLARLDPARDAWGGAL